MTKNKKPIVWVTLRASDTISTNILLKSCPIRMPKVAFYFLNNKFEEKCGDCEF